MSNRPGGLQAAARYDKLVSQRGEVTQQIAGDAETTLAWRAADSCAGAKRRTDTSKGASIAAESWAACLRQEPAIYGYGLHNRQELQ